MCKLPCKIYVLCSNFVQNLFVNKSKGFTPGLHNRGLQQINLWNYNFSFFTSRRVFIYRRWRFHWKSCKFAYYEATGIRYLIYWLIDWLIDTLMSSNTYFIVEHVITQKVGRKYFLTFIVKEKKGLD